MDYGSIVYSSSSSGLLNSLDPVQNSAIRLSIGEFRSSPIVSLQSEASVMPLSLRRERRLVLSHYLKVLSIESHPLHNHCKENPFTIREKSFLSESNIEFPNFAPRNPLPVPFWLLPKTYLNTELLQKLRKGVTSNEEYRSTFNQLMSKYSDWATFYTDGSKTNEGVGAAFYNTEYNSSYRIHTKSSVATALSTYKQYAVILAVRLP